MKQKMTSLQAFKAMIYFLDDYYYKTLSDDLGSLLGDIQLLENGDTWDSAAWNDWNIAVENKQLITPTEAFKGVFNFLKAYYERTASSSNDIKKLLDAMTLDDKQRKEAIWQKWMACIEEALRD